MPERESAATAPDAPGVGEGVSGKAERVYRGRPRGARNSRCQWCGAAAQYNQVVKVETEAGPRRLCQGCRQFPLKLYQTLEQLPLKKVKNLRLRHAKRG